MSSLNQCNFIGRLGKDPETKFTPNGLPVANIAIAVSEKYKDKNTGQMVEKTEWIRCVAFNRQAEIIGEYLRKGSLVFISGKFTTRKWQDQSGQDKYSTEIIINQMQMLDTRGGASGGGDYDQSQGNNQGNNQNNQNNQNQNNQQNNQNQNNQNQNNKRLAEPQVTKVDNSFDNFDDDIPF